MFKKILLCTDGSDHAMRAAAVAADLAKVHGAGLTALHAFTMPVVSAPFSDAASVPFDPDMLTEYEAQARRAVEKKTKAALDAAGVPFTMEHRVGYAPEVILEEIERGGYDMVVVGSRGLGGFKSFLLGSVSDKVAQQAPCPVLIVH